MKVWHNVKHPAVAVKIPFETFAHTGKFASGMAYLPDMPYLRKPCYMQFDEGHLYHIFNRGNNRQKIFFRRDNYLYFLKKVRKFLLPCCDILSYNLMPNHFHFIIHADERTVQTKPIGPCDRNVLSEAIRNILQTYAKAINKQNNSTGSLFQQNTKAKCLTDSSVNYAPICFDYVHQNAWRARLVKRMEDWEFSSFADYAGFRNGTLCNKRLAFELLDIDPLTFYNDSYKTIDPSLLDLIF